MFDALHPIIGPNPDPWPFPKHDWTMKEILIAAVLYLTFLCCCCHNDESKQYDADDSSHYYQ